MLLPAGLYLPAGVGRQVVCPTDAVNNPASHLVQEVCPIEEVRLPLGQSRQPTKPLPVCEYLPAGHWLHVLEPLLECRPAAQARQELWPVYPLYCPDSHRSHRLLPATALKLPTPQAWHAVAAAVEANWPAGHVAHASLLAWYEPCKHAVQAEVAALTPPGQLSQLEAPRPTGVTYPLGQAVQLVYLPEGQSKQELFPMPVYLPEGQRKLHAVVPEIGLYRPAAQAAHSLNPGNAAYLPAGQLMHEVWPVLPWYLPAGHSVHAQLESVSSWCWPAVHDGCKPHREQVCLPTFAW